MNFKLPATLTLGLSILAAIITALEVTSFQSIQPWHSLIIYGLPALAAFNIAPITHARLQTILQVSQATAASLATLGGIAIAAVQTLSWSIDAKGVVIGLITLAVGVLFGTVPTFGSQRIA